MEEKLEIEKATIGTRGVAFTMDCFICIFLSIIIVLIMGTFEKEIVSFFLLLNIQFGYLSSTPIILLLLIFKDIIFGKSLGKRWLKIQVRDYKDSTKIPNIGRLVLRNIFLVVWPFEYLYMFIDRENRRLGDIVSRTDVFLILD